MKVILLMAQTLDGKIAKDDNHFPDWTGKADKRLFVELTKRAGVVIMGSKTYDTIGRPLPDRKNIVMSRNLGRISERENLFFTTDSPRAILNKLKDEGFQEVMVIGGATINTLFAEQNLVDEIILTISPYIFGSGLSLFKSNISMTLKLEEMSHLGEERILVTYSVLK